jgi:uncharacterized membrane protein YGL010W
MKLFVGPQKPAMITWSIRKKLRILDFLKPKSMRKIDKLLLEYGESHRNATNKMVHWICVPLIMFSLIGILWNIPVEGLRYILNAQNVIWVNWGMFFLIVAALYYVRLSFSFFIGMLFVGFGIAAGNKIIHRMGSDVHLWISIGIFVVAWIGQFIGHKIEGKKPSFFKDLQFLLIGPAWLMHFIFKKVGISY